MTNVNSNFFFYFVPSAIVEIGIDKATAAKRIRIQKGLAKLVMCQTKKYKLPRKYRGYVNENVILLQLIFQFID